MEKYLEVLSKCALFRDLQKENISAMLACFGATLKRYEKGQMIIAEGSPAEKFGIVLEGAVQIEKVDFYGNRTIVAKIMPSNIFGESFACAGVKTVPVNAVAAENSTVLFINCEKVITPCANVCGFHADIIHNLLRVVAHKNLMFNQKIEITSRRTTREKLMAYLMLQAKQHNSDSFVIPYDRQELADFLEVDRSGLSSEIGKLVKEGVIESKKNFFRLLKV